MAGHTNNNSILSKGKLMDSQGGNTTADNQGVESTKHNKRNKQSVKRTSTLNNDADPMEVHSSTLSGKAGKDMEVFSGRRDLGNHLDFMIDRETILNSSSGAMQAANQ